MQDLNDLYYYSQVVDHGGFAAAGRALGVPKSKLSRRVALLEERLGVRLLNRSTRHFSVTDTGQRFHTHCKAMLVQADTALEAIELTRAEPRGVVRVTCPVALLDAQVAPMIAAFLVHYPQVEIHLESSNRRVDVLGEGVDLAIRVRPPPLEDTDLVMRVFGERSQCLVASPALLERTGTPVEPADLAALPSLALGQPQHDHQWHLIGPDDVPITVNHRPRLVTRGMIPLRDAAMAGVGVVQMPTMMIGARFARNELVAVLPQWRPQREIIHAVFASRRGLLPSVRALIDFLGERFATQRDD